MRNPDSFYWYQLLGSSQNDRGSDIKISADGNIQYANYQNEEQMIDYLTGNRN